MGTNFYVIGHQGDESIQYHIGKRSAAGRYCYDCGSTFQIHGTREIHRTPGGMSDVCPCCGKAPEDTKEQYSPAMVELGFQKPCEVKPAGISGASSFTWTMMRHKWDLEKKINHKRNAVVDEYGRKYAAKQYLSHSVSDADEWVVMMICPFYREVTPAIPKCGAPLGKCNQRMNVSITCRIKPGQPWRLP